jgi:hypothetical protein
VRATRSQHMRHVVPVRHGICNYDEGTELQNGTIVYAAGWLVSHGRQSWKRWMELLSAHRSSQLAGCMAVRADSPVLSREESIQHTLVDREGNVRRGAEEGSHDPMLRRDIKEH